MTSGNYPAFYVVTFTSNLYNAWYVNLIFI